MNIFILDYHPAVAAELQCDRHVVKMIVESAQMLSTAHRILDGQLSIVKSNGRSKKVYTLPDEREDILYKVAHPGHPSTVWTMENSENYVWHYNHFTALCNEYTYRYGKVHKTDQLLRARLSVLPKKIKQAESRTAFPLAMKANPECIISNDPVKSYRLFYRTKKERFKMVWTKRDIPEWFV
jgi:hypothetical protein